MAKTRLGRRPLPDLQPVPRLRPVRRAPTTAGVRIALATDVGGGTSYSMLRTAAEGYKVLQLNRQSWPALHAFYRMTLGNARALSLDDRIGSIAPGKEADIVVLDARANSGNGSPDGSGQWRACR